MNELTIKNDELIFDDYTKWQQSLFCDLTVDELSNKAQSYIEQNQNISNRQKQMGILSDYKIHPDFYKPLDDDELEKW